MVHRLLRPEVILVEDRLEPRQIRVTGFDLAKQLTVETAFSLTSIADERLVLAAPEVVTAFSSAEPASDQFSLGAILAFLLTGKPLFESTRQLMAARRLMRRARDLSPRIPLSLDEAVARMVELRPTDRYRQGSRGKSTDFLRNEFWHLRGKLDVPKERFIAFTEVPGRTGTDTLYGWAGWTPLQRLRAILAIDEELEDGGVPLADRAGLLDSAWRLLPDVAREDAAVAARLKAELQALVGPEGQSRETMESGASASHHRRSAPRGSDRRRHPATGKKRLTSHEQAEVDARQLQACRAGSPPWRHPRSGSPAGGGWA